MTQDIKTFFSFYYIPQRLIIFFFGYNLVATAESKLKDSKLQ